MKKLIYVLSILLTINIAYSQCDCSVCTNRKQIQTNPVNLKSTVKGTVMDKDDNPGFATVVITGSSIKGGVSGAQTDETGSFGIQVPPGSYSVKISQQGHVDHVQTIVVEENKNLNMGTVRLIESPVEIVLHHTHFTMELLDPTVQINKMELVTVPDIEGSGSSLSEILNSISNVTKSTQGPFTGLEGHNFNEEPAIIYPNPVRDILNVKSTDPITVIEILNVHGQIEKTLNINEPMDVSELAAGTYFARIHFENINEVQIEQILIVK
jgi:hypothetical protein